MFIDGGYGSAEAIWKYKERQSKYVKWATRSVPYNVKQIIGDAFKRCNVEVHYSIEDNDDTLASFAFQDQAAILSRDNDFWRYQPLPIKIYKDFHLAFDGTQIIFDLAQKRQISRDQKRKILVPVPLTNQSTPCFA